jgi:hypothetical protein
MDCAADTEHLIENDCERKLKEILPGQTNKYLWFRDKAKRD